MLTEGAPPVPGTEVAGSAEVAQDTRRGVELVKGGTVAQVKRPDGTVAEIHYPEDAELAQAQPFSKNRTSGKGRLERNEEGRQHHTRPIPPTAYDKDKGSM